MRNNIYLDKKIKYIRDTFIKEDDILKKIKEDARKINREININPEEGQLLQILIKLGNFKKIMEIGTFFGYSTIWLARATGKDAKIYTIERDKESIEKAKNNFKSAELEDKIVVLEGDAKDILRNLNEEFDMIFIDAEKNHYLDYLDWAEKNLKHGGLLIADNTLLSGAVYSEELPYRIRKSTKESMEMFNKRLADDKKYLSILLPAEDGMTIALKK